MRIGTSNEKYCRSLTWLDKQGGISELCAKLGTDRKKGLVDPYYKPYDLATISIRSKITSELDWPSPSLSYRQFNQFLRSHFNEIAIKSLFEPTTKQSFAD
jgi:hypothetical protein